MTTGPTGDSTELWAGFALDPRTPAHSDLRASDADRDRIQSVLADAFADGRLDRGEYDDRAATLLTTRTLGGLPGLVADLVAPERSPALRASGAVDLTTATPAALQARAVQEWESDRRGAFFAFLGPTLICWAIWAFTGSGWGFPWPLFVMIGTGMGLLRVATNKQEIVAKELQRLERKQAKMLNKAALSEDEQERRRPTEHPEDPEDRG